MTAARRLRRRRPVDRDRRRLLHQAPRRRRRGGHQGRTARGRSAAPLVGVGSRDPRRRRRRAVHLPGVVEAERGRRPGRRRRPRPRASAAAAAPTRWCGRRGLASLAWPAWHRNAILAASPAPDRHVDHAVRPGRTRGATAPATEFTLQAWSGGIVGSGRGAQDRAPVFVGGQIGEWLTGRIRRRDRTLASRARALGDGRGELVDVSMLETLILCLTYYPVTFYDMLGRPWRTERNPTSRGGAGRATVSSALGCGTGQQWLDFCVMVGHPEWMEDRSLFDHRAATSTQPNIVRLDARAQRVDEVLELAAAFRIPHAPDRQRRDVPATDHFVARGVVRPTTRVTASSNPTGRTGSPARPARAASRRRGSASTPTHYRERGTGRAGDRRPAPERVAVAAVPRPARPRHDHVLGGPVVHARAGDARRRGHPPRVDRTPRRHPPARRPAASPSRSGGSSRRSSPV